MCNRGGVRVQREEESAYTCGGRGIAFNHGHRLGTGFYR